MQAINTIQIPSIDKIHLICPVATPHPSFKRPSSKPTLPSILISSSATKRSPSHNTITHISGELTYSNSATTSTTTPLGEFSTRHRYITEHHHLLHQPTFIDCVITLEKEEPLGDVFLCGYPSWRSRSKDPCARGTVSSSAPVLPLPCQWASCAVTVKSFSPSCCSSSSTSSAQQIPFIVIVSKNISVYTMDINGSSFIHILDVLEDIPISPRFDQRPIVTTIGSIVAFSSLSRMTVFDIDVINVATVTSIGFNNNNNNNNNTNTNANTNTHYLVSQGGFKPPNGGFKPPIGGGGKPSPLGVQTPPWGV